MCKVEPLRLKMAAVLLTRKINTSWMLPWLLVHISDQASGDRTTSALRAVLKSTGQPELNTEGQAIALRRPRSKW